MWEEYSLKIRVEWFAVEFQLDFSRVLAYYVSDLVGSTGCYPVLLLLKYGAIMSVVMLYSS